MAYTLEQLSADIRGALKADPGAAGKQAICALVSKVLLDKEFVDQHLTAEQCRPRKVLYEDPELGFCVCGHVYQTPATGAPHDHGSSWAIYGLAVGDTEMIDWRVVQAVGACAGVVLARDGARSFRRRPRGADAVHATAILRYGEAIEIVCKCNGARKVLTDFR